MIFTEEQLEELQTLRGKMEDAQQYYFKCARTYNEAWHKTLLTQRIKDIEKRKGKNGW